VSHAHKQVLAHLGFNLKESSWLASEGHLSMMLTVTREGGVKWADSLFLEKELKSVCSGGGDNGEDAFVCKVLPSSPFPHARASVIVEVMGNDRPGIVAAVAGELDKLGIEIMSLDTRVEPASQGAGDLFRSRMTVCLASSEQKEFTDRKEVGLAARLSTTHQHATPPTRAFLSSTSTSRMSQPPTRSAALLSRHHKHHLCKHRHHKHHFHKHHLCKHRHHHHNSAHNNTTTTSTNTTTTTTANTTTHPPTHQPTRQELEALEKMLHEIELEPDIQMEVIERGPLPSDEVDDE
jgi:predicted amino acid-binding ACT domain protein